jgi:hypothetical protein
MKGLQKSEAMLREKWNRLHKKVSYYTDKLYSCSFPSEEQMLSHRMTGLMLHDAEEYEQVCILFQ